MTEDALLEARELTHAYGPVPTLRGVSLALRPGERVGLVGPNGAGKSTLLLLLNGVLQPAGGDLLLEGAPVTPALLPILRQRVGIVFQHPDDMLFTTRVADDVAFGPRHSGMQEAEIEQRVQESLAAVAADHLLERVPHHLSGGEKHRVAIAAVLAMRPQVLLMDEPTSNLDPRGRRKLLALLQAREEALVVASHDLEFVLSLCQRVVVLDEGQVVLEGPTESVLADEEQMVAHGLERPHSLMHHHPHP